MDKAYLILIAYALDLLLGDPHWFPHPVRFIGWLVTRFEQILRRSLLSEKIAGAVLTVIIVGGTWWVSTVLVRLVKATSPLAGVSLSVVLLWTTLATRSMYTESNRIFDALNKNKDLAGARQALSMIVGRDTQDLNEPEIVRATVETIGENISDGIIAPLFYALLGGAPLALAYKASNTLDSMVGYKNECYHDLGWASAKLDDLLNFVPARISGVLMITAAYLSGLDGKGAWRIFWRDRQKHPSPNSAHGEAAMAGALRIQLGGATSYQGIESAKPLLGDPIQRLEPECIREAQRLMFITSLLGLVAVLGSTWTCNHYFHL
ncbi:MAG: cobalamin biosynthesis protein CobD [Candidatus Latescibacteria bacterium]|nr:cobalamin biosynthesis protein CobD [Candidatus Latescibacterota bacterium]